MRHQHYTPFSLSTYLCSEECTSSLIDRMLLCRECRRVLRTLSQWLVSLDHFEPLVAPEFATRHEFFNRLFFEHETHAERLDAVSTDEIYQHWGLASLLLEKASHMKLADSDSSRELAELALKTATLLDPAFYHPSWIADLCAKAAASLAETSLAMGDLDDARENLLHASDWQLAGTHRSRIRRRIATLRARTLRAQGWTDEALDRLLRDLVEDEDKDGRDEGNLLLWFFGQWEVNDWQDLLQHDGNEAA